MAYISQDEKRNLSPAIKAVLKKYNMKGSIGIRHHSTLFVNLQSGQLAFDADYIQVNDYHIETSERYSPEAKAFLTELAAAMRGPDWFDHSDMMTDYFHVAHYISINVGQWNKPYVCTATAVSC
jgi:hypothetical protein